MKVGDKQRGAALPCLREIGQRYSHAPLPDKPGVDEAIDSGEQSQPEYDRSDDGTRSRGRIGRYELGNESRNPAEAGAPEQEIEKAEPDSGDLVDQRDHAVRITKTEQRGNEKAYRKYKQNSPQVRGQVR